MHSPFSGIRMILWIAVEVYQGVVQDVHIFKTEKEAEEWFKKYTGLSYDDYYSDDPSVEGLFYDADYEQTKIFKVEFEP